MLRCVFVLSRSHEFALRFNGLRSFRCPLYNLYTTCLGFFADSLQHPNKKNPRPFDLGFLSFNPNDWSLA